MTPTHSKPDVLLFDVNETLLDLSGLRPRFEAVLGSSEPMGEWFARMLHGSLVANHVGQHRPFADIGVEALLALAARRGVEIDVEGAGRIVAGLMELAAHPDVPEGLERLRDSGYRLATLTNGGADAVEAQLANAGIARHFEVSLSVDGVGVFKPAPEPYLHALSVLGVEPARVLMVAAHDWDIVGARAVGIPGAFLARAGSVWSMPDPPPEIVADLAHLVGLLRSDPAAGTDTPFRARL